MPDEPFITPHIKSIVSKLKKRQQALNGVSRISKTRPTILSSVSGSKKVYSPNKWMTMWTAIIAVATSALVIAAVMVGLKQIKIAGEQVEIGDRQVKIDEGISNLLQKKEKGLLNIAVNFQSVIDKFMETKYEDQAIKEEWNELKYGMSHFKVALFS